MSTMVNYLEMCYRHGGYTTWSAHPRQLCPLARTLHPVEDIAGNLSTASSTYITVEPPGDHQRHARPAAPTP